MATRRDLLSDSAATPECLSSGCEEAGLELKHQSLEIEVDFANCRLLGTTELFFTLRRSGESIVRLNSRQSTIKDIEVNGLKTGFKFEDFLSTLIGEDDTEVALSREELKIKVASALKNSDEGELTVFIPRELISSQVENQEQEVLNNGGIDESDSNRNTESRVLSELRIKIYYELYNPKVGAYFTARDSEQLKRRFPQFYCCGRNGSARCWMPCVDHPGSKCTWEIRIICPYDLEVTCPELYSGIPPEELAICEDIGPENLIKFTAVAPGILKSKAQYGKESKILTVYESKIPIAATDISIAVAPFDYIPIPQNPQYLQKQPENDTQGSQSDLLPGPYCFFLPYRRKHAAYTMSTHFNAINFFEQYFDLCIKFSNLKIIFMEGIYNPFIYGAGVVIIDSNLLLQENAIDQFYDTIVHLVQAIVSQWILYYLFPERYEDSWLITGLLNHLANAFLKKILGLNEFKYRLRKDMIAVCKMDVDQLPLCPSKIEEDEVIRELYYRSSSPLEDSIIERANFVSLKSSIVLHMMEQRAGSDFMKILVREILSCAALGEFSKGLSTTYFLEAASKIGTKLHVPTFADEWIYGSGCPRFHFSYSFSRKKMLVELKFTQKCTNAYFSCSVNKFTGPFTIRIHEPGGTYDTEVCIDDVEKKFDIQYHTKYKRIRRKLPVIKGKKQHQQNLDVTREIPNVHDDSSDKLEWQQEEPARLTFEWIRLDPDCNWLCVIEFEQSDFMWASQLQKDKDVFAQFEAVNALANMPSHGTYSVLLDTMYDTNAYYGIRIEAARALTKCMSNSRLYSAHKHVIQLYKDKFHIPEASEENTGGFKFNNFTQIQDYFVQKAILYGISYIRCPDGQTPVDCYKLIFSLLKHNDNINSMIFDNYYVSCLIMCLGNLFLSGPYLQLGDPRTNSTPLVSAESTSPQALNATTELDFDMENASDRDALYVSSAGYNKNTALEKAISEIQKYRKLDFLVYSYRNTITAACLRVYAKWMKENIIPHQLELFIVHTKYGNFSEIRTTSVDILLELDGLKHKFVFEHLLNLMAADRDPYIRYYITARIFDNLRKRSIELSSVDTTIPQAVQVNRKVSNANNWPKERVELIKDINIVHYIRKALECADSRIYTNIFKIMAVLFWPYKIEKSVMVKELPKLKIRMPGFKSSGSVHSSDDADIFLISSKGAASYVKHLRSPVPMDSADLSPVHEDSKDAHTPHSIEEKLKRLLLSIIKRLQSHPLAAAHTQTPTLDVKSSSHQNRNYESFSNIITKIQENYYSNNLDTFIQHLWPTVENICYSTDLNFLGEPEYALFFQKVMDRYIGIILKSQDLRDDVIISKRSLSKIYEPISFMHPQSGKFSSPVIDDPVQKKPRIKFNVNSSTISETVDVVEQMTVSQIRLCCKVWTDIYKLPESTWYKQDPKDSYSDNPNDVRKSDYVDMFTMLKNIIGSIYKSPEMFRDQFLLTTATLLEKRGIQNSQLIDQILEIKSTFKRSWRTNRALYQKQSPTPLTLKSINDNVLKNDIFAEFVIHPPTKSCLMKYLDALKEDVNAFEFLKPVPKSLYPSYYSIIEHPIDIAKITKNLKSDVYTYTFELEQDIRLMFRNCYKFNHPTGPVYIQGRFLEKKFNSLWNICEIVECSKKLETLTSSDKTQVYRPLKITLKSTLKLSSSESTQLDTITTPRDIPAAPCEPLSALSSGAKLSKIPEMSADISGGPKTRLKIRSTALKAPQKKMCMNIIRSLQTYPHASYFLESNETGRKRRSSSDCVNIKNPINLIVMKRRVTDGIYNSPEQFRADFERMMQNFFVLYPPDVEAHQYGKTFETLFENEYRTSFSTEEKDTTQVRPADDLNEQEQDSPLTKTLKSMSTIPAVIDNCDEIKRMEFTDVEITAINNFLSNLEKKDYALIFSEPVNPEHLKNYYSVIKNPMDLKTVKQRLDSNYYRNLSDFDTDMRLIIKNCYTYNLPSSYGYDCGAKFEKFYNLRLKQIASTIINRFIIENIGDTRPRKRTIQDTSILSPRECRRRSSNLLKGNEPRGDSTNDTEKGEKCERRSLGKHTTALKLTLKLRK